MMMTNFVDDSYFVLVVVLATLVTYIPRALPLVLLSKIQLPKKVLKFLDYIPISVLSAILLPELFLIDNRVDLSLNNTFLMAGLLTLIVAKYSKSLVVIAFSGIIFTILLRFL